MKPRKPGRPKLPASEQHSVKLTVMMRPREAKTIEDVCRKKGLTVSGLLRLTLAPYIEATPVRP